MRKFIISFIFDLVWFVSSVAGQTYTFETKTFSGLVRTLKVHAAGNWELSPIINLHGNEQVEIGFDLLGASAEYLTYKIIHCNADWTLSQLSEVEFMSGLQNNPLTEYSSSFNTTMDYVHYKLQVPNEDVRLQVSGNYVIQVFSDSSDNPLLNACFSVVEPRAGIRMQVSPVTDSGSNSNYQAVSFEVTYGNEIKSPVQDLKVFVFQNNRRDNAATAVKPLSIRNGKAVYDHDSSLIFDAGNEYRSFEMVTHLHAGLNIAAVEYHSPYYHSLLTPDYVRSGQAYSFYEDINGRVFTRNQDAYDSDTEADYQFVHFFLPSDRPFVDEIYILSDAFHSLLDSRSRMKYSATDKAYVKTALLKEGYYNYLYVTKKEDAVRGNTTFIEGNYYQTENEYRVMVYARTPGMRYDRLIGVETLQSK
ncbi:MAG: DUF5103 domain-containing protein [Dysgonamonadaceae bacterium]|jgi:hypothetical protein|nr:DUF5103 domain-containing protein [Dysgonamonadaceae bacterium]